MISDNSKRGPHHKCCLNHFGDALNHLFTSTFTSILVLLVLPTQLMCVETDARTIGYTHESQRMHRGRLIFDFWVPYGWDILLIWSDHAELALTRCSISSFINGRCICQWKRSSFNVGFTLWWPFCSLHEKTFRTAISPENHRVQNNRICHFESGVFVVFS